MQQQHQTSNNNNNKNHTTYQRALANARKEEPETTQVNNSFFFKVESGSMPGAVHNVTLGPNRYNPLFDATCDCGHSKYMCLHRMAAFLKYFEGIENRLWRGSDVITELQNNHQDDNEALTLWLDLLDRYERAADLLKAIGLGWDISQISGPFKDRLNLISYSEISHQVLTAS